MRWSIEEIERIWLRGAPLELPVDDVVRAFNVAEAVRGRDWVLSSVYLPGGGEQWGFAPLWRVYSFGARMQVLEGAVGGDRLIEKLRRGDPAAESELSAIQILRAPDMRRELEIEPEVAVTGGVRRPDFRIRDGGTPSVYVEVTKLNRSTASDRAQSLIQRMAEAVIALEKPFVLEIVLDRELAGTEEEETVRHALEACQLPAGGYVRVGDYASVLVKIGDPSIAVPTPIPDDAIPRAAVAHAIGGPGAQGRQIIVRVPFSDQRAEDVLRDEARQLPPGQCGLVMVDAAAQPTAFDSWPKLIPPRFTAARHTRVAAVLLFMSGTWATIDGPQVITSLTLLPNLHAQVPLPAWVTGLIEHTRAENRRRIGQPG
jgi:hypothetical protein